MTASWRQGYHCSGCSTRKQVGVQIMPRFHRSPTSALKCSNDSSSFSSSHHKYLLYRQLILASLRLGGEEKVGTVEEHLVVDHGLRGLALIRKIFGFAGRIAVGFTENGMGAQA